MMRTKRTKISDNTVDEYRWDYRNRLMSIVTKSAGGSVLKTVGYEYDVDDQRVKKTVDGVVENYFIDRNQIAFVTDGSGVETFHYLYGLNVDAVMAQDSPAGMVWALADRLGSIETLTDAAGVVVDKRSFDSFGRLLNQTNPSVSFRYGYTGRELDLESGLNYYRARYYDPNVGRFISVDPMGFGAGDTNLYRYVSNNSTNANDPTGMWLNFAIGAAIGGVLDLAVQLWEQKGDFSKIDPTRLAISTVTGALGGGIGAGLSKGGFLLKGTQFAKEGLGLGARTAITAGAEFNLGYWGKVAENKITGKSDVFDGALLSGTLGGISGAGGELLQAGVQRAWRKGSIFGESPGTRGVLGENLGKNEAEAVIHGGNGQSIAGHGIQYYPDTTIVPEGTRLVVPRHGIPISDLTGRVLETIDLDALVNASSEKIRTRLIDKQLKKLGASRITVDGKINILGSARRNKVFRDLQGLRVIEAGGQVQDYMIHNPGYGGDKLTIYSNSTTVIENTRLSEILKPNAGTCSLATCTEQAY